MSLFGWFCKHDWVVVSRYRNKGYSGRHAMSSHDKLVCSKCEHYKYSHMLYDRELARTMQRLYDIDFKIGYL